MIWGYPYFGNAQIDMNLFYSKSNLYISLLQPFVPPGFGKQSIPRHQQQKGEGPIGPSFSCTSQFSAKAKDPRSLSWRNVPFVVRSFFAAGFVSFRGRANFHGVLYWGHFEWSRNQWTFGFQQLLQWFNKWVQLSWCLETQPASMWTCVFWSFDCDDSDLYSTQLSFLIMENLSEIELTYCETV